MGAKLGLSIRGRNIDWQFLRKECQGYLDLEREGGGSWRKLHNDELHSLCSAPNIFRLIKSSMMLGAGHVACMEWGEVFTGFGWEAQWEEITGKTKVLVGK
jgi:hypothetical protein